MEFRVLGPLEVIDGGTPVPLGGARQRSLLAALLLRANEPVSTDRLLAELWGERQPETGVKALQVAVSQLRKALGNGRVQTWRQGYVLRVDRDELDLLRFEALAAAGREALEAGDAAGAADGLREALALWQGEPLADLVFETFAQPEIARLDEARLAALEDRVDADLALGRHAQLVGELEALVARNPLRERLRRQLMLALYRSQRQAEALDQYASFRRRLVEDLGIEPGPDLHELQRRILNQDPDLAAPPRPARLPFAARRTARRPALAGAALIAAAAGALVLARPWGSEAQAVVVPPNSVAVIDPASDEVVTAIRVGESPESIVAAAGSVWVSNTNDGTLSQIDASTRTVTDVLGNAGVQGYTQLAAGFGSIWVGSSFGLSRLDPSLTIDASGESGAWWSGVATGLGSVWLVGGGTPRLLRVDPQRSAPAELVPLDRKTLHRGRAVVVGDAVWVAVRALAGDGAVYRYEPATGRVTRIPFEGEPAAIAAGRKTIWVADARGDELVRLRPRPLAVERRVPVGDEPVDLAVGAGSVWTANAGDGTVSRFDLRTGTVRTISVGHRPLGIAFANDLVWVSVRSG